MLGKVKKIDKTYLFFILCICLFGLIMVYSASYPLGSAKYNDSSYFFHNQRMSLFIGLFAMTIGFFLPYSLYRKWSPVLVLGSILMLILVLTPWFGEMRNSSQRWLQIGPIVLQPAEFVKLTIVIYFASIFGKRGKTLSNFNKDVLPPLLVLGVVFLLILLQPDLGTATSIALPCVFIMLCAGIKKRHILAIAAFSVSGVVYLAVSAPYRLARVLSFRDPFNDPDGKGYQLINGYEAISSGGVLGRGIGEGIQKLGFLPEAHTDFIMAVVLEELGILGLAVVFFLYFGLLFKGVSIALRARDSFATLLTIGLLFQIMVQAVFNLGAVSGLLPITGIPLPFISYGGSSLIVNLFSMGIILQVSCNSKHISMYRIESRR
ncbi:cell division-specific peptidoglycan biosynthesis regulator FtsW [Terribacillus aidingensis]|uniref:Probable peptidoglycan glycosyltransferase FtsW n=1 Tax=Terribacillus aidingensis TaxID=586416 RepID=A0A285N0A9_9BACI|nr:cell division-specific peptidoglycan biosynthesis regulator FtsW [Terribacillus aidingensis]